jgi:hypothetical protein
MPKIACKCGYVLNLIVTPSPDGYALVSERMIDMLYEAAAASETPSHIVSRVHLETDKLYLCPQCGRLILLWKEENGQPTFYFPER